MSEVLLEARRREPGRSAARALRRQGVVPGVFYFHGEEPIAVAATELALRPLIFTAESHIVRLRLDDGVEKTCILKEVTFDPITDRATHFDLQGVAANERVRVEVPVALTGSSVGVREGGIVDQILYKLEIECLPKDLPEHIDVDMHVYLRQRREPGQRPIQRGVVAAQLGAAHKRHRRSLQRTLLQWVEVTRAEQRHVSLGDRL